MGYRPGAADRLMQGLCLAGTVMWRRCMLALSPCNPKG